MRTIYITIILLSILSACSSSEKSEAEKESTEAVKSTASVKSDNQEIDNEKQYLELRGHIDVPPSNRASITFHYGGSVKQVKVLEGQKVKKGELLFYLENPVFIAMQQEYIDALEDLNYLKADFERQQQLIEENIASKKEFKKSEAAYRSAKATKEGMAKQLKLINLSTQSLEKGIIQSKVAVRSPIEGYVSQMTINEGKYISATDQALMVTNTEHLHLELKAYEKDLGLLEIGQEVEFSIPSQSDKRYQGNIHLIGQDLDHQDRSVEVHGHFDESQVKLLPGQYVVARVVVK
ncbi:MAG: efflux RND transporter periplasmic adaptor subunit [Reichenbachiella sp.]